MEKLISGFIDLVAWRGCQTHKQRIEVAEYVAEFAEHRAVRLIYDYQVKSADAVRLIVGVDVINHCLICGKSYTGVGVNVGGLVAQYGSGRIGEQLLEITCGLIDERGSVGKK